LCKLMALQDDRLARRERAAVEHPELARLPSEHRIEIVTLQANRFPRDRVPAPLGLSREQRVQTTGLHAHVGQAQLGSDGLEKRRAALARLHQVHACLRMQDRKWNSRKAAATADIEMTLRAARVERGSPDRLLE